MYYYCHNPENISELDTLEVTLHVLKLNSLK